MTGSRAARLQIDEVIADLDGDPPSRYLRRRPEPWPRSARSLAGASHAPASLRPIAERVERGWRAFLAAEHARWSAFDPDLGDPIDEIRRLVLSGRQAAAAGVLPLGLRRRRRRRRRPDRRRRRRRLRADARLRPVPRRRDGRRRQPARRAHHARRVRRAARRRSAGPARRAGSARAMAILVGDLAFVYSDQLMVGANGRGVADLERAARRAQRRAAPRHARFGAGGARSRHRPSGSVDTSRGKYTIERPLHLGAALAAPVRLDEIAPGSAPTACRSAMRSRCATT